MVEWDEKQHRKTTRMLRIRYGVTRLTFIHTFEWMNAFKLTDSIKSDSLELIFSISVPFCWIILIFSAQRYFVPAPLCTGWNSCVKSFPFQVVNPSWCLLRVWQMFFRICNSFACTRPWNDDDDLYVCVVDTWFDGIW